ncbi:hypothetical protein CANARDRAFT_20819 [[Candida] arabinofermentans NRRL YB-2248]|uniref:Aminopeptidase P N-terminal domain-containing protein n=1 Tax=[Candida] arabinofermentans NRRL YB-2248 TaxID=983967 RepID=A0A1E4T8V4_9ASCO|nr:hypothetical protein CANARDRAFT_20819 [[Candida] arabinofermentans NRRL YB-2248]
MAPRAFDFNAGDLSSDESLSNDNALDGGKIRLVTSQEKSTSCFDTLKSLFQSKTDSNDTSSLTSIDSDSELDFVHEKFNPISTDSTQFDSSSRLSNLRSLMIKYKVDCYIIPSEDEHQSEYTAAKDQRREFISGFTGSAGVAIVTLNEAALSTDGRYFLQASKQLDNNWTLLKQGVKGYPTWQEWCLQKTNVSKYKTICLDPRLIGFKTGIYFKEKCFELNLNFQPLMTNLVDRTMILENYKPKLPINNDIFIHDLKFAGEKTQDKIKRLRSFLKEKSAFAYVVSQLEEIAWLFNLRGNDIPYNPVFFSYAIITLDSISLFLDKSKLNLQVETYLNDNLTNLKIFRYSQFWDELPAISNPSSKTIYLSNYPNYALYLNVPGTLEVKNRSIITEFKGIKNQIEIKGHKFAQLKDSIALIRTFAWLDSHLSLTTTVQETTTIDEIKAGKKAEYFRSLMPEYNGLSFETISSSGSNSSIIHYAPTTDDFSIIDPKKIYLCDSGAQYLDGTTDITRTIHFQKPSLNEIEKYTLVLKGHLNVAMLNFKYGTPSSYIDSLARKPLRDAGNWNYNHGTGHGIDTFICVHSGPCGLSPIETSYNYKPLEPGNLISDEPGYYLDNEFGIRIESDLLVIKGDDGLLKFDYLTLVPFCRKLIDLTLLESEQIEWINKFNEKIRLLVLPYLVKVGDERAIKWLVKETEVLTL